MRNEVSAVDTLAAASPPDGVVPYGDQFATAVSMLADVDAAAETRCATSCEKVADFVGEMRDIAGMFKEPSDTFAAGFSHARRAAGPLRA